MGICSLYLRHLAAGRRQDAADTVNPHLPLTKQYALDVDAGSDHDELLAGYRLQKRLFASGGSRPITL